MERETSGTNLMVPAIQKHSWAISLHMVILCIIFSSEILSNQLYPGDIFWAFNLQNPQCVKLKNFLKSWLVVKLDTNTNKTDAPHGTDPGSRLEPQSKAPWALGQNTWMSSGKRENWPYVCVSTKLSRCGLFSFHFPVSVLRSWDLLTLAVLKSSNSHSWYFFSLAGWNKGYSSSV